MTFLVRHSTIRDWKRFHALGEQVGKNAPRGVRSLAYYPMLSHDMAFCLWSADDLGQLRSYLDLATKDLATNEYYMVDEDLAINVPPVPATV